VELVFHKNDITLLKDDDLSVDFKKSREKKLLTFTVRKMIATRLEGSIFWSPFEVVNIIITVTLRNLKVFHKNRTLSFKFNMMDCDDMDVKFSLAEEWGYGFFRMA
jgi:hypothetical protein